MIRFKRRRNWELGWTLGQCLRKAPNPRRETNPAQIRVASLSPLADCT